MKPDVLLCMTIRLVLSFLYLLEQYILWCSVESNSGEWSIILSKQVA